MRNFILAIGLAIFICGAGMTASGEQSAAEQFNAKAVSLAVKLCMKAYITNSDFAALKKGKVSAINRRTAPQFASDYSQAWAVLQKCPDLVAKYRLRANMSKPDVLKVINRLTREDCLAAVDSIPDEVLVDQFNKCINDPELKDKPLNEQIDLIMKR